VGVGVGVRVLTSVRVDVGVCVLVRAGVLGMGVRGCWRLGVSACGCMYVCEWISEIYLQVYNHVSLKHM